MVETQTHFTPSETSPQISTPPETEPAEYVRRELLSADECEKWRSNFATTSSYMTNMAPYVTKLLRSNGHNEGEAIHARVDFVRHVDTTILNFLHKISARAENITQEEALEQITGLMPAPLPPISQRLLKDIISRDHTLIRLENYCAAHNIPFEFAQKDTDIEQGYDVRLDGLALSFVRPRTHGIYPVIKKKAGLSSQQGGFDGAVTEAYYRFVHQQAVGQDITRKKAAAVAKVATAKTERLNRKKPKAVKPVPVAEQILSDAPNMLRIDPIIASKAVGLTFAEHEPPYEYRADALDTTPEALATQIIEDALDDDEAIDFNKIDTAEFGWRVKESIMRHHDDPLITALKEFTVQSCRVGSKILPHELATMLVDAADRRISRAGLRDAMTYLYDVSHKTDADQSNFIDAIVSFINGRSVEVSAQRLLTTMGYEATEATKEQDSRGVDLFVNGVPFDIKSSEDFAHKSARKEVARSQNPNSSYIPAIRFVPPFTRESFEGQVVVPDDVLVRLSADPELRQRIDTAIEDYRVLFGRRILHDVPNAAPANASPHQPTHLA